MPKQDILATTQNHACQHAPSLCTPSKRSLRIVLVGDADQIESGGGSATSIAMKHRGNLVNEVQFSTAFWGRVMGAFTPRVPQDAFLLTVMCPPSHVPT
ncbi:MAG: hypothetical protein P8L85_24365 [Rubripirellula sp.]|nr:hypothetical protein [Rubripirellula sp.]